MKIVQLNATCGSGSTGKICMSVSKLLTERGIENYILYTEGHSDYAAGIKYAEKSYKKFQALKSRIFGNYGFNSRKATKTLIGHLEEIQPDIVHIHNIHGHDCDLEMLFTYFKRKGTRLYWTFHDCWAFTAYCPHFTMAKCEKWKTGCGSCPQARQYSWFFDRSAAMYERKKELFAGLNLEIVTPSRWLAGLVEQSFLKDYPVRVINNGIDLDIFTPRPSDFRSKYQCEDKTILLGVAFGWNERKGLDVFIQLAKGLDERFQIVLVGTDEKTDKLLPDNIISIHRTQNQIELAEIYSAADLFVSPSREENYPTVLMEAIACGTPAITFDAGGCREIVDAGFGSIVNRNEIDILTRTILDKTQEKRENAQRIGRGHNFDQVERYAEYIRLYI